LATAGLEGWIIDGWFILIGCEALHQFWIRPEFLGAVVELACVRQQYLGTVIHWADDAANLDVLIEVLPQISNIFAVDLQANDREAALRVRRLGTADVDEPGSVRQVDDVVDVGGDADVFVLVSRSLLRGIAGPGCGCKCWDE
jgi:hypothetical protein